MILGAIKTIRKISQSAFVVLPVVSTSFTATTMLAQNQNRSTNLVELPSSTVIDGDDQPIAVEILSDTDGVNLAPYLTQLIRTVSERWDHPASPSAKNELTAIRIKLEGNGTMTALYLDRSSGSPALDRAAWNSITHVNSFQPLPEALAERSLYLRLSYNPLKTTKGL